MGGARGVRGVRGGCASVTLGPVQVRSPGASWVVSCALAAGRGPSGLGALFALAVLLASAGCGAAASAAPGELAAVGPSAAPAAWAEWRAARHESLAGEEGWLTLVALTWLEPGESTVGADSGSTCVLPAGHAPARVGRVVVEQSEGGATARFVAEPGVVATVDGAPVTETALAPDTSGAPTIVAVGPIRLHLIARGDRLALRVKDRESPARLGFTGPEVFDYDPALRVRARFTPATAGETLTIVNVLGMAEEEPIAGRLSFELGGASWSVVALPNGETLAEGLFVMLRDATSGEETYGAGRYLDVPAPEPGADWWVDLNFLETPPCGYTELATCPLPPPENELDVAIRGGERDPGGH